ncbi:hypothetical protein ACTFIY_010481 [Dictyostelium cf. discoideum]
MKTDLFLDMIKLTNFINDCVTELFFLDSFQSCLEKDIQMFSNEMRTINVPNHKIPTPVLPPPILVSPSIIPSSTNNSTNLQNQIYSQTTTPTVTSKSPHININNNNKIYGGYIPIRRRSNKNNIILKETMELSLKIRALNQTHNYFYKPKGTGKMILRPGCCYMCPNKESNNWRNFIYDGQHVTLCNACGLRMIKIQTQWLQHVNINQKINNFKKGI